MNSEIRYSYYDFYINKADMAVLDSLKKDILQDKTNKTLDMKHYIKLTRAIVKRKKELRNNAIKTVE